MITELQSAEIKSYLLSKKLPLDLYLEVSDHFIEQVESKVDFENKTFEFVFEEVKKLWENDLELKRGYLFWLPKKTSLERRTIVETEKKFILKSLLFFAVPLSISIFLMMFNAPYAYYFCLGMHIILLSIGLYFNIFEYKLIKNTQPMKRRKLSYAEANSYSLMIFPMYIIIFVLMRYDLKFSQSLQAVQAFQELDITFKGIFHLFSFFFFDWGIIYGLLFFLEYRKSVRNLQKRLHIDL